MYSRVDNNPRRLAFDRSILLPKRRAENKFKLTTLVNRSENNFRAACLIRSHSFVAPIKNNRNEGVWGTTKHIGSYYLVSSFAFGSLA